MRRITPLLLVSLISIAGCIQSPLPPHQSGQQNGPPPRNRSYSSFYGQFDPKKATQQAYPAATHINVSDTHTTISKSNLGKQFRKDIMVSFMLDNAGEGEFNEKIFFQQLRDEVERQMVNEGMRVETSGISEGGGIQTFHIRYEQDTTDGWVNVVGRRDRHNKANRYLLHMIMNEEH